MDLLQSLQNTLKSIGSGQGSAGDMLQGLPGKLKDSGLLGPAALEEPLDPRSLADGVQTADEALEIYTLSCAVVTNDHFMERSYLDALARALRIPDDVKNGIETSVKSTS